MAKESLQETLPNWPVAAGAIAFIWCIVEPMGERYS
jgi:hypothetical protein